MRSLAERDGGQAEALRLHAESVMGTLHVSAPGIIQEYDPESRTATIQLAIREKWSILGRTLDITPPLLLDVPVYFPGGGGFTLAFPVRAGDECLVVFADSCIDAWHQSGGVQNQMETRRHSLSDGFAFVGFQSKPRAVSTREDALVLTNKDGTASISLTETGVEIVGFSGSSDTNFLVDGGPNATAAELE